MHALCNPPKNIPQHVALCRGVFVPSLAQCLQLEDLLVQGRALQEVTRAASSLTRLTRLAVVAGAESGGLEVCLGFAADLGFDAPAAFDKLS